VRFILSLQVVGGLIFLYTAFLIPSNLYFAALLSIFMLVNTVGVAYYVTRNVLKSRIGRSKVSKRFTLPIVVLVAGFGIVIGLTVRIYKVWSEIYSPELFALFVNTFAGVSALLVATFGFAYLSLKRELEEKLLKIEELENLRIKAELEALKSKLNPHFLFNALGGAISMIELDAPKAEVIKYLNSLADLLRTAVEAPTLWNLELECDTARKYLEVQKLRFQDKLSYEIVLPQEISKFKVPALIIQPLVENAVVHNVGKVDRTVHVRIGCEMVKDGIVISISDNGQGIKNVEKGSGFRIVEERLKHLSPWAKLMVESDSKFGTVVRVVIPRDKGN